MPLKIPDAALAAILNFKTTAFNTMGIRLHLFTNNYTPVAGSVLANFTEATFVGYASAIVGAWAAPSTSGGRASSQPPVITFTAPGGGLPQTVYGYYVTDAASTIVYWAERDPAATPFVFSAPGNQYSVQLKLTEGSEF